MQHLKNTIAKRQASIDRNAYYSLFKDKFTCFLDTEIFDEEDIPSKTEFDDRILNVKNKTR